MECISSAKIRPKSSEHIFEKSPLSLLEKLHILTESQLHGGLRTSLPYSGSKLKNDWERCTNLKERTHTEVALIFHVLFLCIAKFQFFVTTWRIVGLFGIENQFCCTFPRMWKILKTESSICSNWFPSKKKALSFLERFRGCWSYHSRKLTGVWRQPWNRSIVLFAKLTTKDLF